MHMYPRIMLNDYYSVFTCISSVHGKHMMIDLFKCNYTVHAHVFKILNDYFFVLCFNLM